MSATTTAPAPEPAEAPTAPASVPAKTPTTKEAEVPAPVPGPTPTAPATTAAAVPEPTAAPEASVSAPPPQVTPAPTTEAETKAPVPQPAQSVPEATPVAVPTIAPEAVKKEAPPAAESKADIVEPQNALTERFTTAEWTALKEFRSQLPDIFAEAFPDKPTARETTISMWGVSIDPVNAVKDARVSVVLMKFLRARNLSVRDAKDMFVSTLRWRESFNIEAALNEDFPQEVFGNLGGVYGKDKGGRPVVYNIYGGNQDLKTVFGDVQRFIRWRVALMERSVEILDFTEIDQTLQIHDYEGVSLTSRDANSKAAASEATNIFQSHYPELLYKKFFVNVPTLLNWIFWAFKPLLSANTLAKMSVVGTGHHAIKKALMPYITEKELPTKYGGEAEAF